MLNVDKKPLCGARKQRWLVSVAWKEKKKIPATAAIHQQQQKKNLDDDDKKNQNNFSRRKFFCLFSVTFFVWRSHCAVCIWRKFFSLSLSFTRRWSLNEFVYVGKWNEKKNCWENKNTRESGKKSWEKRMSET